MIDFCSDCIYNISMSTEPSKQYQPFQLRYNKRPSHSGLEYLQATETTIDQIAKLREYFLAPKSRTFNDDKVAIEYYISNEVWLIFKDDEVKQKILDEMFFLLTQSQTNNEFLNYHGWFKNVLRAENIDETKHVGLHKLFIILDYYGTHSHINLKSIDASFKNDAQEIIKIGALTAASPIAGAVSPVAKIVVEVATKAKHIHSVGKQVSESQPKQTGIFSRFWEYAKNKKQQFVEWSKQNPIKAIIAVLLVIVFSPIIAIFAPFAIPIIGSSVGVTQLGVKAYESNQEFEQSKLRVERFEKLMGDLKGGKYSSFASSSKLIVDKDHLGLTKKLASMRREVQTGVEEESQQAPTVKVQGFTNTLTIKVDEEVPSTPQKAPIIPQKKI